MAIEVAQVLRRLHRNEVITDARADEALVDLSDLDATLLTFDDRLANAPGHHARVEVLAWDRRIRSGSAPDWTGVTRA